MKKKDAEEGAAKMAVLWLQGQQPPPPVVPRSLVQTPPSSMVQRPLVQPSFQRSLSSPAATSKPGKALLKEYGDRRTDLQMTLGFNVIPTSNGLFQCTLTITLPSVGTLTVTGDSCKSKKEAEHDAANKALVRLRKLYGE